MWSDPERLDEITMDILDTVALYYLSGSFASSVLIYQQVRVLSTDYSALKMKI